MGSIGPRFLSAGLRVFDAGLLVISDSISFVRGPVKHEHIFHTSFAHFPLLSGPFQISPQLKTHGTKYCERLKWQYVSAVLRAGGLTLWEVTLADVGSSLKS